MLSEKVEATIKDAAKKLTGYRKRDFMAKVAEDYFKGSARKAESVMGWKRTSVQTGIHERRTGLICVDNYGARGRRKSEETHPNLETDIKSLVDGQVQADPTMQSTYAYTQPIAVFKIVRTELNENGHGITMRKPSQKILLGDGIKCISDSLI